MSKTDSLHYQLCIEGAKWLHKKKKTQDGAGKLMNGCLWAFKYVAVEINTAAAENPDVWGFDGNYSAIIEVKTSHADFLSDRKKWCRSKEAEEVGLQSGTFRWYLCPEGVIKAEEVPDGWGLLYWNGSAIEHIKGAPKHENTSRSDLLILSSILRREGFPTKIYNYRHQNTTIKTQKVYENNETDYTLF